MLEENIVAVYDSEAHADAAVRDLQSASIPSSAISRHSGSAVARDTAHPVREQGFWASLFGGEPDHDISVYDRSLDNGSSVVAVRVGEAHVQHVTDILERHGPIDMEDRAMAYGVGTTDTTTTAGQTGMAPVPGTVSVQEAPLRGGAEEVIQLAEEQLTVGKRVVNQGTTRIRRFVVAQPVEEAVTLRSEHVAVERRPVAAGTRVTDANFTDRTIEVIETAEEAVVGKTARVVEEVVVTKGATERVETVKDTVRREDIEVTHEGGTHPETGTTNPVVPPARPRV